MKAGLKEAGAGATEARNTLLRESTSYNSPVM
jgi:hypothetical protein